MSGKSVALRPKITTGKRTTKKMVSMQKSIRGIAKTYHNWNIITERLGNEAIYGATPVNYRLLSELSKGSPRLLQIIDQMMANPEYKTPFKMNEDTIASTMCFLALIYKNKRAYSIIRDLMGGGVPVINDKILSIFFETKGGSPSPSNQLAVQPATKKYMISPPVWFACTLAATCFAGFMAHNLTTLFNERILQSKGMKVLQDTRRFSEYCKFNEMQLKESMDLSMLKMINQFTPFIRDVDRDFFINMLKMKQCFESPYMYPEAEIIYLWGCRCKRHCG